MRKIIIAVWICLVFTVSAFAQVLRCEPKDGLISGKTHSTDSTSFYQRYYFDIPEGCEPDTLQLLTWLSSLDGDVHVQLRYFWAMRLASYERNVTRYGPKADTYWKLSPDSTALSADFSTEGLTAHLLVGAAKDTLENGNAAMKIWPDAVCVVVQGTTSNRADTHWFLKLLGRKSTDPN